MNDLDPFPLDGYKPASELIVGRDLVWVGKHRRFERVTRCCVRGDGWVIVQTASAEWAVPGFFTVKYVTRGFAADLVSEARG